MAAPSQSATVPIQEYTVEPARCARNEPDCLPEPYNGSENLIVDGLSGSPYKYRPNAQRFPLRERGDPIEKPCEHDGDCMAGRVCGGCTSRFRVPPPRQCLAIYRSELDGALCGCVEQRCRWFTQRLHQRLVSTTKNLQVLFAGRPATDTKLLTQAAELFVFDNLASCYEMDTSRLPIRHHFVVDVGKYGEAETSVVGAHPSVRKCVSDAVYNPTQVPSWIPEAFLQHAPIRFSGVIEVRMKWMP